MKEILLLSIIVLFSIGILFFEGYTDNYSHPNNPDETIYPICGEMRKIENNNVVGESMGYNNHLRTKNEIRKNEKGFYSDFLKNYQLLDDSILFKSPICREKSTFQDNWYEYFLRMIPHHSSKNNYSDVENIYNNEIMIDTNSIEPDYVHGSSKYMGSKYIYSDKDIVQRFLDQHNRNKHNKGFNRTFNKKSHNHVTCDNVDGKNHKFNYCPSTKIYDNDKDKHICSVKVDYTDPKSCASVCCKD